MNANNVDNLIDIIIQKNHWKFHKRRSRGRGKHQGKYNEYCNERVRKRKEKTTAKKRKANRQEKTKRILFPHTTGTNDTTKLKNKYQSYTHYKQSKHNLHNNTHSDGNTNGHTINVLEKHMHAPTHKLPSSIASKLNIKNFCLNKCNLYLLVSGYTMSLPKEIINLCFLFYFHINDNITIKTNLSFFDFRQLKMVDSEMNDNRDTTNNDYTQIKPNKGTDCVIDMGIPDDRVVNYVHYHRKNNNAHSDSNDYNVIVRNDWSDSDYIVLYLWNDYSCHSKKITDAPGFIPSIDSYVYSKKHGLMFIKTICGYAMIYALDDIHNENGNLKLMSVRKMHKHIRNLKYGKNSARACVVNDDLLYLYAYPRSSYIYNLEKMDDDDEWYMFPRTSWVCRNKVDMPFADSIQVFDGDYKNNVFVGRSSDKAINTIVEYHNLVKNCWTTLPEINRSVIACYSSENTVTYWISNASVLNISGAKNNGHGCWRRFIDLREKSLKWSAYDYKKRHWGYDGIKWPRNGGYGSGRWH